MDPRKEKIEGLKGWLSWRFFEGEELALTGYCGDIEEERSQRKMILRKKDFSVLKI
jgi:hypothetical protein